MKEKRYGLFKGILLFITIAIILTWLIPNGEFSSAGFASEGILTRVGLNDLAWLGYYGIYFSIDKIIFLLAIGGLYGVLVKTNAYDRITSAIANKIKHKKIAVVIISVLVAVLTSLLTQSFVVLTFIPFIISILKKMKLDKMTILATTFGSMLVGVMGATYGTEGIGYLSNYITADKFNILYRLGILVVGLILFNFFTILHMNKVKNEEVEEVVETEVKETKKSSIIPVIVISLLLFIIIILGYVNWNSNFGITIFEDFHKLLTEIKIGDDFYIFQSLLGSNMSALGTWDLFSISGIVLILTIILGLCYRVRLDEFMSNYAQGMKRMIKPILCVVAAFSLMTVVYMSPYIATIVDKILSITDGFNLATMTLSSLILNIFHTDLGFTGYIVGSHYVVEYADYINPIYVMLTSLYGFVQFFVPTSILLGVGLTSLNVKYTDWLKYIWKFLIGMIIVLLVIFILMAVI
ncbi:MAG: hypothetical protein E7163_02850 [Firmicutes bacterium]|nr:hypothetical protein [Bacillota bacterium]